MFAGDGNEQQKDDEHNPFVVLPSSFTGGDRYMHQKFQDSIALIQKYGKPHFFLTMTCNPKWEEIKNALKPGQCAQDRPDICSRVFQLKKRELLLDLTSRNLFGVVKARTHVIEFQKRGLPHMHLLIWLEDFRATPDILDNFISAEIPNEDSDLHELVKEFHLRNHCGDS